MRSFPQQWVKTSAWLVFLIVSLMSCSIAAFAQAQANAADLTRFVRDQQGGGVPNATVTARNPATNISRTSVSDSSGFYQVLSLPPGAYELTVEAANFKKAVIPGVQLTVGQSAELNVGLEVGELGATVTISDAATEIVETSRTAVATTIDQQRI